MFDPWQALGLAPTSDAIAIKRAYAAKLRQTRPDDDAAGYQALRESYEMALQLARAALVATPPTAVAAATSARAPAAPAGDFAETTPSAGERFGAFEPGHESAMPGPEDLPAPADDGFDAGPRGSEPVFRDAGVADPCDGLHPQRLEALLEEAAACLAHGGAAALAAHWPRLASRLDDLPLSQRAAASMAFARFALEPRELGADVLRQMAGHFGWGEDFRVDAALGAPLALAVGNRLREAGARRITDPAILQRFHVPLAVDRLLENDRDLIAALFAALSPQRFRDRLADASPALLSGLGLLGAGPQAGTALRTLLATLSLASTLRTAAFVVPIVLALHFGADVAILPSLLFGALVALGGPVLALLAARARKLLDRVVAWKLPGYARVLGASAAFGASVLLPTIYPDRALWIAPIWCLIAFACAWQRDVPWRAMLLPAWAAATVCFQPIFFAGRWAPAISLGALWVLATHWAALHWRDEMFAIYRRPASLMPNNARGWILAVVFFKFYAAVLVGVPVLAMPMTLFVAAAGHGVAFASGMLVLGGVLAWLSPDPRWAVAGFVVAQLFLFASQAAAGRLARLSVFRPAA